jgi:hypothetical protein
MYLMYYACTYVNMYVGAIVGAFFMQNEVFLIYADISRYLAGVFLIMQMVTIIDFAYKWHEVRIYIYMYCVSALPRVLSLEIP